MSLLDWIHLFFALSFVNALIGAVGIQRFLSGTRSISTSLDLGKLKRLVRQQRYMTFVMLGFAAAANIPAMYGILVKQVELWRILLLNGILLAVAQPIRIIEKRAQNLKVEDPLLQDQYRAVCHAWTKTMSLDI